MNSGVLLNTSFFVRLLKENDPLFENVNKFFKYFLKNDIKMYISTISIAEYCVRGQIEELPLRNLAVLPFNINHAKVAGEFARIIYEKRKQENKIIIERPLVINDAKLFAQAHVENQINYYCSSDENSMKMYNILKSVISPNLNFTFINIREPYNQAFGILPID